MGDICVLLSEKRKALIFGALLFLIPGLVLVWVLHQPANENRVAKAAAVDRSARMHFWVAHTKSVMAQQANLISSNMVSMKTVMSLSKTDELAHFEALMATRHLQLAKLAQAAFVDLVRCTNQAEVSTLGTSLFTAGIPYKVTDERIIRVRQEDLGTSRKSLGLSPN